MSKLKVDNYPLGKEFYYRTFIFHSGQDRSQQAKLNSFHYPGSHNDTHTSPWHIGRLINDMY